MNFTGPGGLLSPQLQRGTIPQLSGPQLNGLLSGGIPQPFYGGGLLTQPQSAPPMGLMATATQGMPSVAGLQGLMNPATNWSQIAYQMAGSPHQGGLWPSVSVPAGTAGATGTGGFANSAAGGITLGLLGVLAKNPSLLQQIPGLGQYIAGNPNDPNNPNTWYGNPTYTGGGGDPSAWQQGNGDTSGDPGSGDPFDSAGGAAAMLPDGMTPAVTDSSIQAGLGSPDPLSLPGTLPGGLLSDAGSALGIASGIQKGGLTGYGSAALDAGALASKTGLLNSPGVNNGVGLGADALGIYTGLQQGGVTGDASAAVNAAKLGAASGLLPSAVGTVAGYAAAPLAVYNAINNFQSGATGTDTLNDAEAGAAVGSIVPGIGTAVGALGGAAVGALSSLFGPGKTDPETQDVQGLINAVGANPSQAAQLTSSVQDPYLELAGLMDERSSTLPMYSQFGRMGEQAFTNAMVNQINSAPGVANMTPQQVYSQVVAPWVSKMGSGWSNVGTTYQQVTQGLLQDMVSQYMSGQAPQDWKAVGGDDPFSNIAPFGGSSAPATPSLLQPLRGGGRYL